MPEIVGTNRVFLGETPRTWAELARRAQQGGLDAELAASAAPVAFVTGDVPAAFEVAAGMAFLRLDGLLLGHDRYTEGFRHTLATARYHVTDYPGAKPAGRESEKPTAQKNRVGLLTSGSTGAPKLVRHTWDTLFTGQRCHLAQPHRWLVPYQVGTYAWFQLVTLGLFQPGQDLVPLAEPSGAAFLHTALDHGVDSISSTPTMWRLALLAESEERLKMLRLRQITLGGEPVDQGLLDRLRGLYPDARITQIFASAEAGACIVVQDGKAGFPAEWLLARNPAAPSLRIVDGRLWVQSAYSASAAAGRSREWVDTGDRVEQRGERVIFLGRAASGTINVGGAKLFSADIEAVVLQHPAVCWCRVRGASAPVVGSLPVADFVVRPGCPVPTEAELAAHCRERLPELGVPRFWNRLESIPVQESLKAVL